MPAASILVVDDSEDNRVLLSRRLYQEGYSVTSVPDGYEALEALRAQSFDLVVLDILMPGMSGISVLQLIRQQFSRTRLPVVMVTAKAESSDMVEAMQVGANDYVTKPIDFPVLLARVQTQLAMRSEAPPEPERAKPRPITLEEFGVGTIIDERYEVLSLLGKGGFAVVFCARQISTGQTVAIKILRAEDVVGTAKREAAQAQLRSEMELIGRLNHPNVVRLVDSGDLDEKHLYLVLEYVEGKTLQAVLAEKRHLPPREAQHLMLQVLDALSCAHSQGIVHLDLKPDNIMIVSTGHRANALVLDFGIATIVKAEHPEQDGRNDISGTPLYMSPEMIRGEPISPRMDIYSWGLILLECLSGVAVMQRDSVMKTLLGHLALEEVPIPPSIRDPGLRAVLTRATAKDHRDRYQSAGEAFAALDALELGPDSVTAGAGEGAGGLVGTETVGLQSLRTRAEDAGEEKLDSFWERVPEGQGTETIQFDAPPDGD